MTDPYAYFIESNQCLSHLVIIRILQKPLHRNYLKSLCKALLKLSVKYLLVGMNELKDRNKARIKPEYLLLNTCFSLQQLWSKGIVVLLCLCVPAVFP